MSLLEDIDKEDAGVSLLDELENSPEDSREYIESEKWMPDEAGDKIEGVVIDTFKFGTDYAEDVPGLVIRVDGDETPWSVAGLHKVLRDIIEEQDPQKGDRVAYIFTGSRQGKSGNPYKHYRGAIRRGGASVKPVPAQRAASNGSAKGGSTQHEPVAKAAPAKRKPGQATKPVDSSDAPDF